VALENERKVKLANVVNENNMVEKENINIEVIKNKKIKIKNKSVKNKNIQELKQRTEICFFHFTFRLSNLLQHHL